MASASVNYELCPQKKDGTYPIRIRLIYKKDKKYHKTSLVAEKKYVSAKKKLKKCQLLTQVEDLLVRYRKIINELELDINDYSIEGVYQRVFVHHNRNAFDFVAWARAYIEKNKNKSAVRTHYSCALNKFVKFMEREKVMTTDMTSKTMRSFEASLDGTARAQSSYTASIKKMFTLMCDEYNDYDYDDIVIRNTMASYKPPKEKHHTKRALTIEQIRSIFALPYDSKTLRGNGSRHDLALDCFRLSFCLLGINSADLYLAERYEDSYIIYNRQKTRSRRDDEAEIKVKVLPCIQDIFNRYRDEKGKRVFNFYTRYAGCNELNAAINKGLKQIGEELGIDNLTYYAARHSMATIAVNDVGINKYVVHDMLNHVGNGLGATDIYIKKDFKPINDANEKLLEFVFG